jgi:hypothetical protein
MTDFGGFGGVWDGLPFQAYDGDLFARAVERQLGEKIRADREVGVRLWSALANVDWKHANGDTAAYSFRAAGDLIASICGKGMYMDWYCSGPYATVSDDISEALGKEGWTVESTSP